MQNTMYFKGSRGDNYMIRSEKRPSSGNTSPRGPRRPRQGWYAALTTLLLIVCWPVGLILLWRKQLRWSSGAKFFLTLLSLAALFLVLGAALIYPFRDERVRAVQTQVSGFIEQTGQRIRQAPENWRAVSENAREIGAVAGNQALGRFLDLIASPTPEPTPVPPLTLKRSGGDLSLALALLNRPVPTPWATFTPEPTSTPAPTAEATQAPEEGGDIQLTANTLDRPTPTLDPSLGLNGSNTPVLPRTATPSPDMETNTPSPTAEPVITEQPSPTPGPEATQTDGEAPIEDGLNLSEVKNGDELVYYVDNISHYHRFSTCASSTIIRFVPHKLMDALLEEKVPCPVCNPPLPVTE